MNKRLKLASILTAISMATALTLTGCSETTEKAQSDEKVMAQKVELVDNGVSAEERENRPMRILLINDDGHDGMGIQMLFDKLTEVGYEAWMVAPLTNQSGTGTSILWNKEAHELVEYGDKKYAFEGTPSDCFKAAVHVVMPEKPDLVISGVNDGPNFGEVQFNSGTVGGAARAVRHGYPAIAASLNILNDENLEGFMIPAVDFAVNMVNELNEEWKAGNMLMPLGTGLSYNYPAVPAEEVQGVKFIENEEVYTDFQNYAYDEEKGGIYNSMDMDKFMGQIKNPEVVTDLTEANRGFVTITVIDGNWNAEQEKEDYMKEVLKDIQP
ncbi:5'/3'-nucleotidase SurE [Oceanirhabdus seepicola]|uniref:5'-nucleotidase n=1 Tax=Oceanirhabdus seepicola TaxID=2828781 RepID=A0A9J6NYR3_9CLOT|nr:5'/3'-nucleotidase SurE [Oceanirhabdus seepicola]MCM1989411.1 5'/3'-nucleotidase SurE [Oceanirhabdus seepicola]